MSHFFKVSFLKVDSKEAMNSRISQALYFGSSLRALQSKPVNLIFHWQWLLILFIEVNIS